MKQKITSLFIAIAILFSLATISHAHEPYKQTSNTQTGVKIGAGAAVGAGIGALIGGGRGAAAGALLGGGLMTGHSIAKKDSGYSENTRKIATVATGTAIGTGVGAAIGGGKGAGIGALIGAGSSALYTLTHKDSKHYSYQTFRHR